MPSRTPLARTASATSSVMSVRRSPPAMPSCTACRNDVTRSSGLFLSTLRGDGHPSRGRRVRPQTGNEPPVDDSMALRSQRCKTHPPFCAFSYVCESSYRTTSRDEVEQSAPSLGEEHGDEAGEHGHDREDEPNKAEERSTDGETAALGATNAHAQQPHPRCLSCRAPEADEVRTPDQYPRSRRWLVVNQFVGALPPALVSGFLDAIVDEVAA